MYSGVRAISIMVNQCLCNAWIDGGHCQDLVRWFDLNVAYSYRGIES